MALVIKQPGKTVLGTLSNNSLSFLRNPAKFSENSNL